MTVISQGRLVSGRSTSSNMFKLHVGSRFLYIALRSHAPSSIPSGPNQCSCFARPPDRFWSLLIKRAIDFFAALFGLIALAPLMIFVAIAVKITSPGPVFFSQMRSEKYGCSRKRVLAFFPFFRFFSGFHN